MNGASVKIWRRTIDLRRNVFLLYFFNGVVKESWSVQLLIFYFSRLMKVGD